MAQRLQSFFTDVLILNRQRPSCNLVDSLLVLLHKLVKFQLGFIDMSFVLVEALVLASCLHLSLGIRDVMLLPGVKERLDLPGVFLLLIVVLDEFLLHV